MILTHLTLNGGDIAEVPREQVADAAVNALRPLYRASKGTGSGGGPVPGGQLLHVDIWPGLMVKGRQVPKRGVASFQIGPTRMSKAPYVMGVVCGVDDAEDQAWSLVEMISLSTCPVLVRDRLPAQVRPRTDKRPGAAPWLAVALGAPVLTGRVNAETIALLGDLERCLAWAILEEDGLLTTF